MGRPPRSARMPPPMRLSSRPVCLSNAARCCCPPPPPPWRPRRGGRAQPSPALSFVLAFLSSPLLSYPSFPWCPCPDLDPFRQQPFPPPPALLSCLCRRFSFLSSHANEQVKEGEGDGRDEIFCSFLRSRRATPLANEQDSPFFSRDHRSIVVLWPMGPGWPRVAQGGPGWPRVAQGGPPIVPTKYVKKPCHQMRLEAEREKCSAFMKKGGLFSNRILSGLVLHILRILFK